MGALVGPLFAVLPIWLLPWALFAAAANEKSAHLTRVWSSAGALLATNFVLLVAVFLHRRSPLPSWAVAGGFLFTFLALIGAYASADLVASHETLAGGAKLAACYTTNSGVATTLRPVDAIYFALSTVTTAGFGDISPHSETCRWLTSGELGIGFPILGLAIGGVAGRMLAKPSPST